VALPRGNPEYWAQVDASELLRKDLKLRDKEIEALRRKLREAESTMQRERSEMDNLNVQIGSLERLSQKLQMDLEREVDQRRRAESSVASLSADKNSLEDQMEGSRPTPPLLSTAGGAGRVCYTLHPNLHLRPYILHPIPYLTPDTLQPTPYTLPYTLYPTPYRGGQEDVGVGALLQERAGNPQT